MTFIYDAFLINHTYLKILQVSKRYQSVFLNLQLKRKIEKRKHKSNVNNYHNFFQLHQFGAVLTMVCVLDGANPLWMTLTGRWGQDRRHPLQQVPVLVKEDQVGR